jgi:hypothetical protein
VKNVLTLLGLLAFDVLVIWFFVYRIPPDPSTAIALIIIVSFVFLLNVIIAGVFFWFKRKEYGALLLVNSVLASLIMYFMFQLGADKYQDERLESWKFSRADTTFSLIRWKKENAFSMSYSLEPGSSWGFLDGECQRVGNDWILKKDSIQLKIQG